MVFVPIIPTEYRLMIYVPDIPIRMDFESMHGWGLTVIAGWLKSLDL